MEQVRRGRAREGVATAGQPASWPEALDRLSRLLGPEDAVEWLREAVRARLGAESLHDLDRTSRAFAFQRTLVAVELLEQDGVPDELLDGLVLYRDGTIASGEPTTRERVSAAIGRAFGVEMAGPPWSVSVNETDRPTREAWAGFG